MRYTLALAAVLLTLNTAMGAGPRDDLWKRVDEAVSKGLPRSAITNLTVIITGAVRDRAWGEAAKAIGRRIVIEGNIEGNKTEEKITRMEAEIEKAPREIVPLLRALQANWYWHYFQNNRWRFLRRTATAEAPGPDFATWDLPRLFVEIDKVFGRALAAADELKRIPIRQFDDLLTQGALPDAYRPTLYDFIAQEALKFYTSGEQAGAKPEDAFEIPADSPILSGVDAFLAWTPPTTDTNAAAYKAIRLYQDVLRFHQNDPDPTAFIDADLARLVWGQSTAFGENREGRFKAAMGPFVDRWADHEVSALALSYWARVAQREGDLVEARRLALRGERAHPESPGGLLCHNLVREIEAKSAAITTERVWNEPYPKILVRYRNVTNVSFRMVAWDWNEFLNRRHRRPESLTAEDRSELLRRTPVLEWSAPLPLTPDYKERVEELPAPTALKPGFYFIVASHDPTFADRDNQISYTDVWVSNLALVVVAREGTVGALVLNANSGEPIAGAEVVAWYLDGNGNRVAHSPPQHTDSNGWASFSTARNRQLLLRARAQGQELGSTQEYYSWRSDKPRPNDQVAFFTDRALYRPGQTISYKGIAIHVDQERDQYECLAGRVLEVAFLDPNGKEVAKTKHRANDYGSFSGSFTAPRDRMMGQYQLVARVGVNYGMTHFSIEEYKRPKFQVSLEPPKTAPRLNDSVSLRGKAEAYTGAAVDGAQVKWRVVREVRWPDWWSWWGGRSRRGSIAHGSPSQEIAHGITTTKADGGFRIEFNAKPDPQVDQKSEAAFDFHVYADVTDTAGETRSADRGVTVGFVALRAQVSADEWQTDDQPVEFRLGTTTLDGEPQKAEGSLKIVRLQEPGTVQRASLPGLPGLPWNSEEEAPEAKDLSNPMNWGEGDTVSEQGWTTDAAGNATVEVKLGAGVYRALLETQDRFGKKVTGRAQITVLQPSSDRLGIKVPNLVKAPRWQAEPGDEWMALWGTGYDQGRAFVEVEHRNQFLQRFWTKPAVTQGQIKLAVTEAMRGGFTLHVTQVRENRAYFHSLRVEVPWSNKELDLSWEHFVSKLQPGQRETWTAVIKPAHPDAQSNERSAPAPGSAERLAAECVATLYDESLDQFQPHHWGPRFRIFRQDYAPRNTDFCNLTKSFELISSRWYPDLREVRRTYRAFPADLVANLWGYQWARGAQQGLLSRYGLAQTAAPEALGTVPGRGMQGGSAPTSEALDVVAFKSADGLRRDMYAKSSLAAAPAPGGIPEDQAGAGPKVNLAVVTARKNLNETAFFFPHLTSDSNGVVRMTFTMPEALTQWRFLAFAHDQRLRSGLLEDHAGTAKDIMVQPNPPRFLRDGDVLEFTVKVSNQSAARQTGKVRLTLAKADTDENVDSLFGNNQTELPFDIPAKESRSFSWRLTVPDQAPFLVYRAVASTGRLSDGEEGYLPVLSRRILVTESLPLPIRVEAGQGEVVKKFRFSRLLESGTSESLVNENLVFQMVPNPAWYAVMALPYLMEFPHACTEQVFNRLYANALARSIAQSDPKIRRIFDLWKNTPALDSPLEKNQDLKSVMIEETPWLRQAQNESQARKNVGLLFDANRLEAEIDHAARQLAEMQLGDGAWPWFPGGRGNDYITLYITTGFGRLRHLGVDIDVAMAVKSLRRLDGWMDEHYREILRWTRPEDYVPNATDALYLYGRSFFLKDVAIGKEHADAIDFFLKRARQHWLKTDNRQSQGHLALALKRWGGEANVATARDIMRSIKERSVSSEEFGMFWRDLELSWWWYRAPIETQALMIEAFDEVMGDRETVEECRVWLLKQKQTQDWKTTKATADAVYSLLLRGKDILASDKLVEVTAGGMDITAKAQRGDPDRRAGETGNRSVEPGTGFCEARFTGGEIVPQLGEISVRKVDEGVAWGSVHWQYLEDMTKLTPYEGTPLRLKKTLYTKAHSPKGPQLQPVKDALAVGDELVVRIELRTDRDMEYVHLKDQRGSGTEPVNVLSRYKYQDGLAYYESTRDTASHFFIDYLPKGTYVFEYSTRIQHRGRYQTGIASIQCMYAPEFNSHSESYVLNVR